MGNITLGLFGQFQQATTFVTDFDGEVATRIALNEPPLLASWTVLFLVSMICLALLSRKVKAYEVVR
jgi:hypothetical protein